jgi:hypothetical protein
MSWGINSWCVAMRVSGAVFLVGIPNILCGVALIACGGALAAREPRRVGVRRSDTIERRRGTHECHGTRFGRSLPIRFCGWNR